LAKGGALQDPHVDNQSRGGHRTRRAKAQARHLASVPRITDPWAARKP
jgi:hypothetical protein